MKIESKSRQKQNRVLFYENKTLQINIFNRKVNIATCEDDFFYIIDCWGQLYDLHRVIAKVRDGHQKFLICKNSTRQECLPLHFLWRSSNVPGLFEAGGGVCPESEGGAPGVPVSGAETGSLDGGGGGAINGGEAAIGGWEAACTLPMAGKWNSSDRKAWKIG